MMDLQDFNRVFNQLRVKLTGASDAGIKAELYDVLFTFFNDSGSWIENLTFYTVPDQLDYGLVPDEGQIVRLAGVLDGNLIPVPASMPEVGTLHLRDKPQSSQELTVTVIKTVCLPNDSSNIPVAPDWVLKLYPHTIMAGVLGQMQAQSNTSWYDARSSAMNLSKFRSGIGQARSDAYARNTLGVQAWSFPQTFRTRGQRGGVSTTGTGFK